MNKYATVRQIANGYLVTTQGGTPVPGGSGETYIATLEEVAAFFATYFAAA